MSQKISELRRREFRQRGVLRDAKLLHLQPCKTSVVDVLKEHEPVARMIFFFLNWCLQSVRDGEVSPQFVFFCD